MQDLRFPIHYTFKISSLSNDFNATDANGMVIAYVKQKLFKLKEDILVYSDESKANILFNIKADKWLDFSTAYRFTDENGQNIGKIVRKGWRSIWKAQYDLIDEHDTIQYTIREENAWIKVIDSLFGEIPILNILTGYLFNPSYIVLNKKEEVVLRLKKLPSLLGKEFKINKLGSIEQEGERRLILGTMMMILLERRRG